MVIISPNMSLQRLWFWTQIFSFLVIVSVDFYLNISIFFQNQFKGYISSPCSGTRLIFVGTLTYNENFFEKNKIHS